MTNDDLLLFRNKAFRIFSKSRDVNLDSALGFYSGFESAAKIFESNLEAKDKAINELLVKLEEYQSDLANFQNEISKLERRF